jgi:hypothetical protein
MRQIGAGVIVAGMMGLLMAISPYAVPPAQAQDPTSLYEQGRDLIQQGQNLVRQARIYAAQTSAAKATDVAIEKTAVAGVTGTARATQTQIAETATAIGVTGTARATQTQLAGTATATAMTATARATQTQIAETATARAESTAEALSVKAESERIEAEARQRMLSQARQGLFILGGAVLIVAGIGALVLMWRFALEPRLQFGATQVATTKIPAVMVDERGRVVDEGKPEPLSAQDIARIVQEVPEHGAVTLDPAAAEAAWNKLKENGDLERAVE